MEKEIEDAASPRPKPKPKPFAQKLFKRGRSFRGWWSLCIKVRIFFIKQLMIDGMMHFTDIQSEISKINPEVLKAVIASGSSASTPAKPPMTLSSFLVPSTPREHHSFLPPLLPLYTSTYRYSSSITIYYTTGFLPSSTRIYLYI